MTEENLDKQHQGERLEIEKDVLQYADNPNFRQDILPQNPERIDAMVLNRALETLLGADSIELSEPQRLELFKQTLEYYSGPTDAKLPVWHSTSSYVLRKALEEGFSGGHGKYSGEAGRKVKKGEKTQEGLSVSHPKYHYAEVFQQMAARASAKKSELGKYLAIDSEKITGKTLPEVFLLEMLSSFSEDETRELAARMLGIKPEEVTQEQIGNLTSEEAKKAFIEESNKAENLPVRDRIEEDVLPKLKDENLKIELGEEIDHPFPCFITFEGAGKESHLAKDRGGIHIPFEDRFYGTLKGQDIREIRVPQSQMGKVRGWLEAKGLNGVTLVPLEVYEIKRIIQNSI